MTSTPTKEEIQIAAQVALIERLRISEKRYSDLVNSLSSIVFSIDPHGHITFLNDTWLALIGHTRSEMQGQKLSAYILSTETNQPFPVGAIIPTVDNPLIEFKCKVRCVKGAHLWFSYSAKLDPESGAISGLMHDISNEVKLAEERAALSQARNNFFSGMSHELRTPINGTILASDLIIQSSEGEIAKYANSIQSSAKHLLDIIDEILDYSKAEAAQLTLHSAEFDIINFFNVTTNIFKPICLKKGIDLVLNISEDVPRTIFADEKRLKQILNNLLSNACKFTDKGTITVTVHAETSGTSCQLLISVSDTGIGISTDFIPGIFTPFKQADDSIQSTYGGTGLGLSLTKELVELMEGNIEVESELNAGTTFFFDIKCLLPDSYSQPDQSKPTTDSKSSEIQILIVEDDAITAMALEAMLIKHHQCLKDNITVAPSGREMRRSIAGRFYDLVFMDCNLPDTNGAILISELREHATNQKFTTPFFVFATASTGSREAELIEKCAPDIRALKPITTDKLSSIMQRFFKFF